MARPLESPVTAGTVPIHHQIADSLRARIDSGGLAPGDPLPTVGQLREEWGCAVGSVKTALNVLKGEGRITGGRGRPAIVRLPPRRIRLSYMDLSQAQKDLVFKPKSERMQLGTMEMTTGTAIHQTDAAYSYDIVTADTDLAAEFGISEGSEISRRVYEMRDPETGQRLAWSVSYIPLDLLSENADLLDQSREPWPGGHQHQLYTVGIELDRFTRSIISIEPTPGERQQWGMELGIPMLRIRSRSIDISNRTVEISDASYPADRTEISFTEKLARWPTDYPPYDPYND